MNCSHGNEIHPESFFQTAKPIDPNIEQLPQWNLPGGAALVWDMGWRPLIAVTSM